MRKLCDCHIVVIGEYRILPTIDLDLILTTNNSFGLDCIYEWLSPTNIPNRNTCPKCRAVLFEIDHSGYSDDEDDSDTEEAPNIDVIPELRALLDIQSFESFVAALDFIEPFMQGDHLRPRAFRYSRQIHAMFHTFSHILDAEENLPSVVVVQDIARKLAALMGLLYVTFGPQIEFLLSPVPWRENGPPVHDLLDQNKYEMISVSIHQFMRFEGVYYQRPH